METRWDPRCKPATGDEKTDSSPQIPSSPSSSPPAKRVCKDVSNDQPTGKIQWKQRRGPSGRFQPKKRFTDVAWNVVEQLSIAAEQESDYLFRKRTELDAAMLKRAEQIRVLKRTVSSGIYNNVIQPTPGIFDEDDLYDILLPRPDGTIERMIAPPVALSPPQRMRLASQCTVVAEYMKALNKRDADYLERLTAFEQEPRGPGRRVRPSTRRAKDIAEEVVQELGEDCISAKTLLAWRVCDVHLI